MGRIPYKYTSFPPNYLPLFSKKNPAEIVEFLPGYLISCRPVTAVYELAFAI